MNPAILVLLNRRIFSQLADFTLAIDDSRHAHAVEGLALTQHNILLVQDSRHLHVAERPTIHAPPMMAVDYVVHGHVADNIVLIPENGLTFNGELLLYNGEPLTYNEA